MRAVARRTVTASGCSDGNDSMSASTCRQTLSLSGSIAFTLEGYGAASCGPPVSLLGTEALQSERLERSPTRHRLARFPADDEGLDIVPAISIGVARDALLELCEELGEKSGGALFALVGEGTEE